MKFGILSTAKIGNKVSKAIHGSKNGILLAVASRSIDKAKEFADLNKIPRFYGSYEELLKDKDVDAIYVPLPTNLATEWCIKIANAGKHVLCDKPFADASSVEKIIQACAQNKVQFMDNTMFSHHKRTHQLFSKETRELLGNIKLVNASFSWLFKNRENIRLQKELEPLGALGDLGWYCVRFILLAYEFEMPIKVFATATYLDNDKENSVITSLNAIIWFKDDRIAKMDCSFDVTIRHNAEIVGDKSAIRIDDFVMGTDKSEYTMTKGLYERVKTSIDGCVQESDLIDCFANGIDDSWGIQSLTTQKVCDLLFKSAYTGDIIEV